MNNQNKPKFDPNKPFEVADKPKFDPNKPFEEVKDVATDYGPFDKETVEKSPQAQQNFERWKDEKNNNIAVDANYYRQFRPEQAKGYAVNNTERKLPETQNNNFDGFGTEISKRGQRSGWNLNEMLANTPDFINRVAVEAFNISPVGQAVQGVGKIAEMAGLTDTAENWKLKAYDLRPEQVNQYIANQKQILTKEIAKVNPKHEQGIIESAQNGDWVTFTRNLAGGVADSFAPSLAMMVSGGTMGTAGMITGGTAVFGAGKYAEMDQAAPNMPETTKVLAAATNGALEGIFETYLGSGAVGTAIRKVIAQNGRQAGKDLVQQGLRQGIADILIKHPALAPLGEGFEEWGTQVTQNYVDKISGYKPDINIFDGAGDALLIGMASGAVHSAPLYGAKAIVGLANPTIIPQIQQQPGQQPPATPEAPQLTVDPAQQQDAMRNQYMQESEKMADMFVHENGSYVAVTDKLGAKYFIKKGDIESENGLLFAINEQGQEVQLANTDISKDNIEITPDRNSFINARLQAYDQQLNAVKQNTVVIKGQRYLTAEGVIDGEIALQAVDETGNPMDENIRSIPVKEFEALVKEESSRQDAVGRSEKKEVESLKLNVESENTEPPQTADPLKPKYPLGKDGQPDIDKMDEAMLFEYNREQFGEETAVADLQGDIKLIADKIAKAEKKLLTADTKTKIKTRMEIKSLTDKMNNLKGLLPQIPQTISESTDIKLTESANNINKVPENVSEIQAESPVNKTDENLKEQESSKNVQPGVEGGEQKLQAYQISKDEFDERTANDEDLIGWYGSEAQKQANELWKEYDRLQTENPKEFKLHGKEIEAAANAIGADWAELNSHENQVRKALAEGKQVYDGWEKDYPELSNELNNSSNENTEEKAGQTGQEELLNTVTDSKNPSNNEVAGLVSEKKDELRKKAEAIVDKNGRYFSDIAKWKQMIKDDYISQIDGLSVSQKVEIGKNKIKALDRLLEMKKSGSENFDKGENFDNLTDVAVKIGREWDDGYYDLGRSFWDGTVEELQNKVNKIKEIVQEMDIDRNTIEGLDKLREKYIQDEIKNLSPKVEQSPVPTPELTEGKKSGKKKQPKISKEDLEIRKEQVAKALSIEPMNIEQAILQYILAGNRLNYDEIKREVFPKAKSELNKRIWMLSNKAETIDNLRGILNGYTFEEAGNEANVFRNAVLDVVLTHDNRQSITDRILQIGSEKDVNASKDEEFWKAKAEEQEAKEQAEIEAIWENIVDNSITENELIELYLDYYGTGKENIKGTVSGDNQESGNGNGEIGTGSSEGNGTPAKTEERQTELRAKLKSQEKELSKAQSAYTNASTKHAKLADKLKSDEFGNRGQADIFGNNGAQRAGVLDFGNVQDEMAAAKQAVSEAKKEVERLRTEVNRIAKAIEKTKDEIRNQQEIKFGEPETPKKDIPKDYAGRVQYVMDELGTQREDWKGVPITGWQTATDSKGKEHKMPIFDFPKGFETALTVFTGDESCSLCGTGIKKVFWLQNNVSKQIMPCGSECFGHSGEGISGNEFERKAKIEQAEKTVESIRKLAKSYNGKTIPSQVWFPISELPENWKEIFYNNISKNSKIRFEAALRNNQFPKETLNGKEHILIDGSIVRDLFRGDIPVPANAYFYQKSDGSQDTERYEKDLLSWATRNKSLNNDLLSLFSFEFPKSEEPYQQPIEPTEPAKDERVPDGGKMVEPWEMKQRAFALDKNINIEGKVEIVKDKPVYKYSTTINGNTYEITSRGPLNGNVMAERLHKKAVEQAIANGKQVPEEVLADYPELKIAQAEAAVNTNPTDAQKEAGNYKKGHVNIQGLDITIENPKGSTRSGKDASGKEWSIEMQNSYGYFKRTNGKDGDQVDLFLGDNPASEKVFVVDQNDQQTGEFDESKVMLGFDTAEQAKAAYLSNYSKDWKGFGQITETNINDFKTWLNDGKRQRKPFGDYKNTPEPVNIQQTDEELSTQSGQMPATGGQNTNQAEVESQKEQGKGKPEGLEEDVTGFKTPLEKKISSRQDAVGSEEKVKTEPTYGAGNKIVSTDRYEELKQRMKGKLGNLNVGFDPEMFAIGAEMAAYHIEAGARKFADFAKRMTDDLGEAIKPYLKSFYNGARDFPGLEDVKKEMDSAGDVESFDLNGTEDRRPETGVKDVQPEPAFKLPLEQKLDEAAKRVEAKAGTDITFTVTSPIVKKQHTKTGEDLYTTKLVERVDRDEYNEINRKAKKHNGTYSPFLKAFMFKTEQGAIDFRTELEKTKNNETGEQSRSAAVIEPEIKAVETEAANVTSSKQAGKIIEKIDDLLTEVEANLKLKQTAYSTEGIDHEQPNIEVAKQIKKDVDKFSKALAKALGWEHDTDKKGKAVYSHANIAPAGGEATFILWKPGTDLGVYVSIPYHPEYDRGYDDYKLAGLFNNDSNTILWRTTDKKDKYRGHSNQYAKADISVKELKDLILKAMPVEKKAPELQPSIEKNVSLDKEKQDNGLQENNSGTPERNKPGLSEGVSEGQPAVSETDSGTQSDIGEELTDPVQSEVPGFEQYGDSGTGEQVSGTTGRPAGRNTGGNDGGRNRPDNADAGITPVKNSRNLVLTPGENIIPRGDSAKINANIAAIKVAKRLNETGNKATLAQMETLKKYTGWGGLSAVFKFNHPKYQELKDVLTKDEYDSARQSTTTSFFTPLSVVNDVWKMIEKLGFKGGNVLEPSSGIGHFFGLMPEAIRTNSNLRGIELDNISGMILKALYPDAKVSIEGFEDVNIANNSLDLVVSNVPFGGFKLHDSNEKDISKKFNIHDFFIAKSIRKLKPGGIGVFITTTSTLDRSEELRKWVVTEGNADFIDAFRMNTETFKESSGTEASADIIIIQKRGQNGKSVHEKNLLDAVITRQAPYTVTSTRWNQPDEKKTATMYYNKFFVDNPLKIAGEMKFGFEGGNDIRPTEQRVAPVKGKNQDEMLKNFIEQLPENILTEQPQEQTKQSVNVDLPQNAKEGGLVVINGKAYIVTMGEAVPVDWNANKTAGKDKTEVLQDYLNIKTSLDNLVEAEINSDPEMESLRKKFNKAYDIFVDKYGTLNNNTKINFLSDDIDFPAISAIENVTERTELLPGAKKSDKYDITKSDIFSKRVIGGELKQKAETIDDAINVSNYAKGRLVPSYAAGLLGMTEEDFVKQALSKGKAFKNPQTGLIESREDYLSGNVVAKLKVAEQANETGEYTDNISSLKSVIPTPVPLPLISLTLGSTWVPTSVYERFFDEAFNVGGRITKTASDKFVGDLTNEYNNVNQNKGMMNAGVTASDIALDAMNNKLTIITRREYDPVSRQYKYVKDVTATAQASQKQVELSQEFEKWVKQEGNKYVGQLETIYNETFNSSVEKKIDVSGFDKFPGATETKKPRQHQKEGVMRSIDQATMLAHEVGTGKTITLITTAMEMRRLGLAKKPVIVVQRSTYKQFINEIKSLYPGAKVLVPSSKDLTAKQRQQLLSKIAYNDWDIVVLYHSYLDSIPDEPSRVAMLIEEQIEEKQELANELRDSGNQAAKRMAGNIDREIKLLIEDRDASLRQATADEAERQRKEKSIKQQEKDKQAVETRMLRLLDRKTDNVSYFDNLGVDALLIDEAHAYKKLGFNTNLQGIKGIDTAASKRAQSLRLKTQLILERNNGKNVVLATGTPISNTMAEMWTWLRFLLPKTELQRLQMQNFDSFVNNFGEIEESAEFSTSGKFKVTNRFKSYSNLPELQQIWRSIAHVVLTEEIETLKAGVGTPELKNGKPTDIYLLQTPALKGVMKAVKDEIRRFENMSGKEKKENRHIPLVMFGLAKKAAIDVRLVNPNLPDDPGSKLNETVRETVKALKESEDYNGTVAIFCDAYQSPDGSFNVFRDIKKKLVGFGMPENQIAVIHDYDTDDKKAALFAKVNSGQVRVVLGTTEKLGVGVNIQERLGTLIHMDAPIRPSDYQQRNGRIIRQGNLHLAMNKPVNLIRIGVEKTLDVTGYQRLAIKEAFIKQLMKSGVAARTIEEIEVDQVDASNFSHMMASISGSQAALALTMEENKYKKLLNSKDYHRQNQGFIATKIYNINELLPKYDEWIAAAKDKKAKAEKRFGNEVTSIEINGKQKEGNPEELNKFIEDTLNPIIEAEKKKFREGNEIEMTLKAPKFKINGVPLKLDISFKKNVLSNDNLRVNTEIVIGDKEGGVFNSTYNDAIIVGANVDNIIPKFDSAISVENFDKTIRTYEQGKQRNEEDLANYRTQLGKPFDKEKQLEESEAKIEALRAQMEAELAAIEAEEAQDNVEAADISDASEIEEESTPLFQLSDENLQLIDEVKQSFKKDQTEEEKFETLVAASEKVNEMTGNIAEVAVVRNADELQQELINDEVAIDTIQEIMDDIHKMGHVLGGIVLNDKIYLIAQNIKNAARFLNTWLHETAHVLIMREYEPYELEELYKAVGDEYLNEILPEGASDGINDATKGNELIAYAIDRLMTKYSFADILGSEVNIDHLPLPLQYAVDRIIQRLKEYGRRTNVGNNQNNRGKTGTLYSVRNTGGNEALRSNQERSAGTDRDGSQRPGSGKPVKANYPLLTDYLNALEEWTKLKVESLSDTRPLTEKEFGKKYKGQHKDIRSKGSTFEKIKEEGFNTSRAWVLPISKGGKPTDITGLKYGNTKGDFIFIVPKEYVKNTAGGWRVKEGWKPTDNDYVKIKYDGQSTYEAYLDKFKEQLIPETITINGKERPTKNSTGQFIHPTLEGIKNFWKWFGESKVVDKQGRPLVVYHGTPEGGFNSFSHDTKGKRTNHSPEDVGFHFTNDKNYASAYSLEYKKAAYPILMETFGYIPEASKAPDNAMTYNVYLSLQNPMFVDYSNAINKGTIDKAINNNNDGIIGKIGETIEYVVFSPTQIKSATGNQGTFNTGNSNINYQIIGETGAANLDKAEEATTRLDNLRVAKEMEQAGENINGVIKDENGNPVTFFHGTNTDINKFDLAKVSDTTKHGRGFSFTDKKYAAEEYADFRSGGEERQALNLGEPKVIEANLIMNKPFDTRNAIDTNTPEAKELIRILVDEYGLLEGYVVNMLNGNGKRNAFAELSGAVFDETKDEKTFFFRGNTEKFRSILERAGYDSVISEIGNDARDYFVFKPEQIVRNFTPQQILLATGWQRGADGKWRYEVPDGKLNTKHFYKEQRLNRGKESLMYTGVVAQQPFRAEAPFDRLENLWEDAELYKAYPELKNIRVFAEINSEFPTSNGSYSKESSGNYGNGFIKAYAPTEAQLHSVILHEIQHAIQEIEGFARGGNEKSMMDKTEFKNKSLMQEYQAGIDSYFKTKEGKEVEKIIDDFIQANPNFTDEQSNELDKQIIAEYPAYQTILDAYKEIAKNRNLPENSTEAYKRLAGETESRNVQTRMDYTPEQRRQTLLEETEDVSRKDQIFIYDGVSAAMSEEGKGRGKDKNNLFTSNLLNDVLPKAVKNYEERENRRDWKKTFEYIREFWQDINLPIRRLETEIEKRGGKIWNKSRPYRDTNLSFGRMEELYREFTDEKMTPILEAVRDIVKAGKENAFVLPYIISKHAIERNRVMRMQEYDAWIEANEEATPEERTAKLDELGKKDYSGVRGFDPDNKYEDPDQLAGEIVEEFENNLDKKLIDNLWEKIGAATGGILDHWKTGGQISAKQYDTYKSQYKYFVPLRGWRHGAAKNLRYSKGEGFGASLKHAEGRKSLADNPLAYMQAVAFKAIGERITNEINQGLLNLVMVNYDRAKFADIYSVKKVYYIKSMAYNHETGQNEEVWDATLIKPDAALFESGDAKAEYYGEHMKLRSKFEGFQHEVIVHREDGDVAVVFTDDYLSTAQAFNRQNTIFELNGKLYDAQDLNKVARVTGGFGLTNFMKGMFTSNNPVFPLTNFFRDVPEAALTMWIQDGNGKVPKNIPVAMKAVRRHLTGAAQRARSMGQNTSLDDKLRDFYVIGAATGYTHSKTPEEIEAELVKQLDQMLKSDTAKGKVRSAWTKIIHVTQKWNQLFEDTTRFAVYLSSLEAGKSKEDAALDAKEASVNFNRKGKGTKLMDSIWAFFNPAIQAAQKNFKLAKDHPGRFAAVAGSVAMLGFIEAMLNDLGDGDDDEYYDLNEYVRHNYAVIGLGKRYVRIPLPQFWRGFHSLGVITYDLMKGKTTAGKAIANTTLNFMGGLSPVDIPGFWVDGEFSISPLVPTWAKPMHEISINRDFMHNTIAKEPFTEALKDQLAESTLHKKNVNPAIKAVTDFLAKDIGGRYGDLKVDVRDGQIKKLNSLLDWNPSQVEHLLQTYFGGLGRVASDFTTTLLQLALPEEDFNINNVPFINSFIRNTPEEKWGTINKWYDFKEMAGDYNAVRNYARRNHDIEKYKEVNQDDLRRVSQIVDVYDGLITTTVKAYGMDSEQGSKQVIDLMEQAMKQIDNTLKE